MNTIYQVDAFTAVPFKGNPAGVMIVDEHFPAEKMQQLAMEMNLSESAFIIPNGKEFRIRYFTPNREVPLCGHATLASGHIIYELGLKKADEAIVFKAEGGVSIVNHLDTGTHFFLNLAVSTENMGVVLRKTTYTH